LAVCYIEVINSWSNLHGESVMVEGLSGAALACVSTSEFVNTYYRTAYNPSIGGGVFYTDPYCAGDVLGGPAYITDGGNQYISNGTFYRQIDVNGIYGALSACPI